MKQNAQESQTLVAESKKHIKEITPQILKEKLESHESMHLIDVREDHEWLEGFIPLAIHLRKDIIESKIENTIPNKQEQIIVYCRGGVRSAFVAERLESMGYSQVYSLKTGVLGWMDAGYSIEKK